jgi:hypothetical protein
MVGCVISWWKTSMHGWKNKYAWMKNKHAPICCVVEKELPQICFGYKGVQMNSTRWFCQEHTCSYEERIVYIVLHKKRVCSIFSLPKGLHCFEVWEWRVFFKIKEMERHLKVMRQFLFQSWIAFCNERCY